MVVSLCSSDKKGCPKDVLHTFAHEMPKVTLHVHLEGSILPETVIRIAKKNNVAVPFSTAAELRQCFRTNSLPQFIVMYEKVISCLKTPDDYEYIAYEFGKTCARQHIVYAEVIFSLAANCKLSGLEWKTILEALNRGRARAQDDFQVRWNWVIDLTSDSFFEPELFVDMVIQARDAGHGVVAMGLSDSITTAMFPQYQRVIDRALAANLAVIPHAGEFEGADNVRRALALCKAVRIDHGVRCSEDPSLVCKLVEAKIPLDVCVTSNVWLGVFSRYQDHPIRKLWDAGIMITVGADDPALFDSDLNQEYDHLIDDYNFTVDELECVSLNGVKASLLSQEEKDVLHEQCRSVLAILHTRFFGNALS